MNNRKSVYEQIIEWLDTHNGEMPRGCIISKNGRVLNKQEMTEEEQDEVKLYQRWLKTPEYRALKICIGISLDDLPTEYEQYKEKIATLRSYIVTTYEKIVIWLEMHNGKMPRGAIISEKGKVLNKKEMTPEEQEEVNLYHRWYRSTEFKVFQACKRISLDELPTEYVQYKKRISILRSYGYGLNKRMRKYTKSGYEQILEWLETHKGKMPRGAIISKKGKVLTKEEMTPEEQKEVNLYHRWYNTPEFSALQACKRISLDELPPEYEQYKEQIATLRRYEQLRNSNKLKRRMQRSVGMQVGNNNEIRQEIVGVVKDLDTAEITSI